MMEPMATLPGLPSDDDAPSDLPVEPDDGTAPPVEPDEPGHEPAPLPRA
jgi:hypothetical protein